MDVLSSSPLRVAARPWVTASGRYHLTVVCKATFSLTAGVSELSAEQDEPSEEDTYWDDDPRRSLSAASDLAPYKRRADVVLVGNAWAPGGAPARSIVARLLVGEIDKAVEAFCDRAWTQDGQLREGPPVTKVPLRYERAAGGPDTWNPAGVPHDAPPDIYGMVHLPNLQPPGLHIQRRDQSIPSIGFGPIAPTWLHRASRVGQLGAAFNPARWSEAPVPDGLDPAFFNVAPRDQQVSALREDERIILEGLSPAGPRLVTNLPGIRPRAVVERPGRGREEMALACDTLWIDTNRRTCALVWRGWLALGHPREAGRVVVSLEDLRHARAPAGWQARPGEGARRQSAEETYSPGLVETHSEGAPPAGDAAPAQRAVMPFVRPASAQPPAAAPSRPRMEIEAPVTQDDEMPDTVGRPDREERAVDPLPFRQKPGGDALPFRQDPAATALPFRQESAGGGALPFRQESAGGAALPFRQESAGGALPFRQEPAPPAPVVRAPAPAPPAPAPPALVRPSPLPPAPAPAPVPLGYAPPTPAPRAPLPAAAAVPAPPPPAPAAAPSQPPLWGPLATPEMAARAEAAPAPPSLAAPAPEPPAPAPPAEPSPGDFPIERCAAVAARIAQKREKPADIVKDEGLTPERWAAIEQHWAEELRKEAARGRANLLRAYDVAYVEQLEKDRGPVQVEEYARLAVASERGVAAEVLADLGLPRGAGLRLDRVWLRKAADDPALGQRVREAIRAAREE